MAVPYSKKRLMKQAVTPTFTSKKIEEGTVCTINDVIEGKYEDRDGNEVPNDILLVELSGGGQLKLSVKEFNKMTFVGGEAYEGESGNDNIMLPDAFRIVKSEPRMANNEEEPRYATYAYKGGAAFVKAMREGKGNSLDYIKDVIQSGLTEPCHFEPLQNYTVEIVE